MANYTDIISSQYHFGNEEDVFDPNDPAEFVGLSKDFLFDCPGIDAAQTAVLMFQSFDVNRPDNILKINGVPVPVALRPGPAAHGSSPHRGNVWIGNDVLVYPETFLREVGNVLHIESRADVQDPDDFKLDNMVIMYKTITLT